MTVTAGRATEVKLTAARAKEPPAASIADEGLIVGANLESIQRYCMVPSRKLAVPANT